MEITNSLTLNPEPSPDLGMKSNMTATTSMKFTAGLVLALYHACAAVAQGQTNAPAGRDRVLENRFIARRISTEGVLATRAIENKLSGRSYAFDQPDEFRITFDGGKLALTAKDFTVSAVEESTAARCVVSLADPKTGVKVRVTYWLPENAHWVAKRLEVEPAGRLVNEIDVERLPFGTAAAFERFDVRHDSYPPWDWPGGRPVYIDRQLFAGLEYPAGYNEQGKDGVLRLHHFPGRRAEKVESKTAVVGVAPDKPGARVEDAFALYLARIRIHPPRRFVLWDAYFQAPDYSDDHVRRKIEDAGRVFRQQGLKLDATLVDGGWTDPKSLMEENPRAPGRLELVRNLSKELLDAPIGVHVLTHGRRWTINRKWMAENFDMVDEEAYCFADSRASDLETRNLLDLQKRHRIAAFKFDWGKFNCGRRGHSGHIDGEAYSREAITDATIRMLAAIHAADPGVYLYNTGWYSPWWLMHYDAVYSGENDYNVALAGIPAATWNDLQVSWRDQVVYRNLVAPRPQFPLSAVMNHSPITYQWTNDKFKADHGPLSSYADVFVMNFLRGNALFEMYMNLSNFDDGQRRIWAQVMAWAKANDRILLADSRFVGGEPFQGGVYGYAHFTDANDGLVGLRNPSLFAQPFAFALDEQIGFHPGGAPRALRVVYPFEATLGMDFKYGDRVEIPRLERAGVMVVACGPVRMESATVRRFPAKPGVRVVSKTESPGALDAVVEIQIPDGAQYTLVSLVRVSSIPEQKGVTEAFAVDGAPSVAKRSQNGTGSGKPAKWDLVDGWVLNELPLAKGKRSVSVKIAGAQGPVKLWLAAEGAQDDALPIFKTGLPAAWKDAARCEWPLLPTP